MKEELEAEVLSYREFKNRQTLLEWERRRRAHESQLPGGGERRADGFTSVRRTPTGLGAPAPR